MHWKVAVKWLCVLFQSHELRYNEVLLYLAILCEVVIHNSSLVLSTLFVLAV